MWNFVLDPNLVLTNQFLISRIALPMEVSHVDLGVYQPQLYSHLVDEFFYFIVFFAVARTVSRINTLFNLEYDALTYHGTFLVVHGQVLLLQIRAEEVKEVRVSDPGVPKVLTLFVFAKVVRRAPPNRRILLKVNLIFVPVLLHLKVSDVQILFHFI